jgi:TRAP-type C4-dicarboxylate transport system permease small subunit
MNNKLYITFFEYLSGILLAVMVVCILLQVLLRGFLNLGLSWTEEMARYTMIWLTYIGAIVSLKQGSHIAINILVRKLSPTWQKYVNLLSNLLMLFFLLVLVRVGIKLAFSRIIINQLTPGLQISTSYVYSALPISVGIMVMVLIGLIVKDVRQIFTMKNERCKKCQ